MSTSGRKKQPQDLSSVNEDRYKMIFDASVDVIVQLDRKGRIADINKGGVEVGGYQKEELIGKRINALAHIFTAKSLALIVANFAKRMIGISVKPYEVEARTKDGVQLFFEVNAVSLKDNSGKKVGVLALLHDISDRKKMRKKLEQQKNLLETTIENMVDGLFLINRKRRITKWNRQAERMTGFKEEEVLGKDCANILKITDEKGRDICKEACPMEEVFKTKHPYLRDAYSKLTYFYTTKDGKKVPTSAAVAPILDKKGNILGGIKSFRDITREKEIDKAKSEFVSLASHQLRTPLSTISWYAEMLLACDVGDLSKEQRKYLIEIYQANKRMAKLVTDLLNVSRIEMGIFMVEIEPLDIREIADTVMGELLPKIKRKKLNVSKQYDKDLPNVALDAKLMRIILQNLLSNAVKYTQKNGKIEIQIKNLKKEISIKVSDTGIGIPESQQSMVFTKMFRADNVLEIEPDGTGLGLYIVKSIIDITGGKIYFKSQLNKGTTFYVNIPMCGMKKKKGSRQLLSSEAIDFATSKSSNR